MTLHVRDDKAESGWTKPESDTTDWNSLLGPKYSSLVHIKLSP